MPNELYDKLFNLLHCISYDELILLIDFARALIAQRNQ